jgi:hypothetical protein
VGLEVAIVNLEGFKAKAMAGGPAAARAMARQGKQLDREMVSLTAHAPHTRTPSPAGGPPSMISGRLMESMWSGDEAPGPGTYSWTAHAGPGASAASYNGPYGRFLQFGGVHAAHNSSGYMHWYEGGAWHRAVALSKDSRDYLRRAIELGVADGSLHRAAVEAFLGASGL